MTKYAVVKDGKPWLVPRHVEFLNQCCDCGMVHLIELKVLKVDGGKPVIKIRMHRKDKQSKAVRKNSKFKYRKK